jgi:hypothetical protein
MKQKPPLLGFILAILVIVLTFSACTAPSPAPLLEQFSDTFEGVCNVWSKIRDKYPQLRESAILLREVGGIDDETWQSFVWIDQNAKKLDGWLALVCEARAGANNAHVIAAERASVDWNQVGASVLKVAAFALSNGIL